MIDQQMLTGLFFMIAHDQVLSAAGKTQFLFPTGIIHSQFCLGRIGKALPVSQVLFAQYGVRQRKA